VFGFASAACPGRGAGSVRLNYVDGLGASARRGSVQGTHALLARYRAMSRFAVHRREAIPGRRWLPFSSVRLGRTVLRRFMNLYR